MLTALYLDTLLLAARTHWPRAQTVRTAAVPETEQGRREAKESDHRHRRLLSAGGERPKTVSRHGRGVPFAGVMTAFGTSATCPDVVRRSAYGEEAALQRTSPKTRSGTAPNIGGRASALPSSSHVNLFCYRNCVVNLDAQVANCALDLGMAEQQLNGTQVAGSSID